MTKRKMVVEQKNNTLGIVALVLGILSILLGFSCGLVSIVGGIAAVLFGILGAVGSQNYATAGLVLGAIGIIVGLLITLLFTALIVWPAFMDPSEIFQIFP